MNSFLEALTRDAHVFQSTIRIERRGPLDVTLERLEGRLTLGSASTGNLTPGLDVVDADKIRWYVCQLVHLGLVWSLRRLLSQDASLTFTQGLSRTRGLFAMSPLVRITGLPVTLPRRLLVSAHHVSEFRPFENHVIYSFLSTYDAVYVIMGAAGRHQWRKVGLSVATRVTGALFLPDEAHGNGPERHMSLIRPFQKRPHDRVAVVVFPDKNGILHQGDRSMQVREGICAASLALQVPILDVVAYGPNEVVESTDIYCSLVEPRTLQGGLGVTALTAESYRDWRVANKDSISDLRGKLQATYLQNVTALEAPRQCCAVEASQVCSKRYQREVDLAMSLLAREFPAKH